VSVLAGKRVVVTRAHEQAAELCSALAALGAVAVRCPTIRIAPATSYEALDAACARLDSYDWVVFTSANGVRAVLAHLAATGVQPPKLSTKRVAAVGRATAHVLHDRGVSVAYVPDQEGSRSLGEGLPQVEGSRVLLARGDKADPTLARILAQRGARLVDAVTAYRTLPTAPGRTDLEQLRKGIDAVTFTSPSTVSGFVSMGPEWRELLRGRVVVTIGPSTTAAARASGLQVTAEARERSERGMIEALISAFEGDPARRPRR
jgi:uroporphyrinogen-III synthase